MLKKYFIMAIAAGLALVACSEKFDEPGMQPAGFNNVHTLSVGIEAGTYTPAEGETKASMEAVIRVNWTKDDEVSVVNATTKKILGGCLKATDSGVSVTFEGTVTGTINQNDKLYYIYPRLDGNTVETDFENTGYDVSLAGQTYDGENPGKVSFYGYAEDVAGTGTGTISKKIQFTLVTSYAHLNMANLPAKGFNLSSIDISKVNKGFKWSLSDSKELTADAYGENEGISVNCSNCKITQAGNAVVRFAIPASAATGSEPRVVTVNKAYTNDKYVKDQLIPSAYYNQLYTTWENNVKVTSQGDKTKVDITTSEGSTDVAEGVIPVAEAFVADKETEIGIGGVGIIKFNETATNKIKNNAGSADVFFKVEDVTNDTDVQNKNIVYEVTMKTVDEKGIEVFAEGKAAGEATVTVPLGEEVVSVESVKLLNENGEPIEGGVVDNSWQIEKGILTFKVNHFSKYAIQYTVNEDATYVAQIGNSKYTTLARAIAAVQNGNTIKLLCDCMDAEGIVVPGGKNFTLDFGGHTYKVTKDLAGSAGTKNQCFQLLKGSTLVFQNGTITTSCAKLGINSYSDLIVKDVTVDMSQTSATGQVACLETCNGSISLQGNTSLVAKEGQIAVLALYWPNGVYGDINVELNATGEVKGLMAYGSYQAQDLSTVAQHSHVAIKNGKYDVTFDMDNLDNYDFKIYGGVFKTSPDTKYLAPNYEVVTNTDSETSASYPHKVQQKPYVAQIGSTKYTTLANAIAAAQNGNTIQMIADFATTDNVTVGADKNIVLDLNGKKISYTTDGYGSFIENKGQLKIMDSGQNGIITANFSKPNWSEGCYTINNAGTYDKAGKLVIESGTIENTSPGVGLAWPVSNGIYGTNADLEINGGTIHSTNYVPVREYLQCGGKKTVVINGGKFISDNSRAIAIQVNDATIQDTGSSVTINGGEFTCNGSGILYVDLHAANVNMTGFTMTVNDGKFSNSTADAPVLVYDNENNPQTSAVLLSKILKGGIYSKEPVQELIAFGYHIETNTDSQTSPAYPWRVAANPAANAEVSVSKPGQTTVYSTLAAFRDETNAGNTFAGYTVTLLKDIDLTNDDWVPIGTFGNGDNNMYFGGIFDGDNHKISLRKTGISGDYGLFMSIGKKYGTELTIVKNLNLDVYLTSNSTNKTYIGGLADTIYGNAELENITVTGEIITGCYAGSLAGFAIEYGTATIKNCINKANITVVPPAHAEWSCIGGLVAQFDYTSVTFKNCRNEGKLSADHSKMSSKGSSYIGHMIAKGNYKNSPHDLIIENCTFYESATITGWDMKEGDYKTYPFEGKIAGTEEYTYGSGTPNLGKQMVGGYFKSCSLDGVIQNNIYPNGNSDVE